jgi:hypothetical protein
MKKRLELLVLFVEIEGKKLSKLVGRKWLLQPTGVLALLFRSLGRLGLPIHKIGVIRMRLSSNRKIKSLSHGLIASF